MNNCKDFFHYPGNTCNICGKTIPWEEKMDIERNDGKICYYFHFPSGKCEYCGWVSVNYKES